MDIELTRSNILKQIADKIERMDCDGGAFDRVTREKAENSIKIHDTLQNQFTEFMKGQTNMQTGIIIITICTSVLALVAGGTLVWNVLKVFLKI